MITDDYDNRCANGNDDDVIVIRIMVMILMTMSIMKGPTRLLCQIQVNCPGVELLANISKDRRTKKKKKKRRP